MVTSAVCELARANARALEEAMQRSEEGPQGESFAEVDADFEDVLAATLHDLRLPLKNWDKGKAVLRSGAPAHQARPFLLTTLEIGRSYERIIRRLTARVDEAKKRGVVYAFAEELPRALAETQAMVAEAEPLLELLDRPRKPVSPEHLRLAREAFLRGEGRDARDVLAERGFSV